MGGTDTKRFVVVAALQLALVAALCGAGWLVYRRLPAHDPPRAGTGEAAQANATALRIVLREAAASGEGVAVRLYPIDVAAARREFEDERRYGQRFEEFMTRRMGARRPLAARLGPAGETVVAVPHGRWWLHATLEGPLEVTWRLPVNVAGREQTVELSEANAFTKTKSF
ncbi:MAG TPA: hypothetical protein VK421_05865 [Pyrinomonadaceae bacterium]|nr:hypothetical protein [Pyrinomonadaceae bacterium]